MWGRYAVENSHALKKGSFMSAGGEGVHLEGSQCGSWTQRTAMVNAFSMFCCVDAVISAFGGCMDFSPVTDE